MGLKIISGFIIPSSARRRGGQAFLNLTTGQFSQTTAFTVSDHRVTGSGRFVRRPHVILSLRRIGAFVDSIGRRGDSLDYNLGDTFHQVVNGSPSQLEINWILLRRIAGTPTQLVAEDTIREISYLVIGETDEPAISGVALIAGALAGPTQTKRTPAGKRKSQKRAKKKTAKKTKKK